MNVHNPHVYPSHEQRVYKEGEEAPVVVYHLRTWDLCFRDNIQQKTVAANKYMSKNNKHHVNIKTKR